MAEIDRHVRVFQPPLAGAGAELADQPPLAEMEFTVLLEKELHFVRARSRTEGQLPFARQQAADVLRRGVPLHDHLGRRAAATTKGNSRQARPPTKAATQPKRFPSKSIATRNPDKDQTRPQGSMFKSGGGDLLVSRRPIRLRQTQAISGGRETRNIHTSPSCEIEYGLIIVRQLAKLTKPCGMQE